MKLSYIFEQLTYGEFAQLGIGGMNESGILERDYPKVISMINTGLTELHTRFRLSIREVVVRQYDYITEYFLDEQFAQTNSETISGPKYIDDSPNQPFTGGVLKIHCVKNELGETMYKNDSKEYWSVKTPSYNSIQIQFPAEDNAMFVEYHADHARIPSNITDPSKVEVRIPNSHLRALLLFVAHRFFSGTAAVDGATNKGMEFFNLFEAACVLLKGASLESTDETTNTNLEDRGWV